MAQPGEIHIGVTCLELERKKVVRQHIEKQMHKVGVYKSAGD